VGDVGGLKKGLVKITPQVQKDGIQREAAMENSMVAVTLKSDPKR